MTDRDQERTMDDQIEIFGGGDNLAILGESRVIEHFMRVAGCGAE